MLFESGIDTVLLLFLPWFSRVVLLLTNISWMRCSVASSRLSMAALRVLLGSLDKGLGIERALATLSCLTRKAR